MSLEEIKYVLLRWILKKPDTATFQSLKKEVNALDDTEVGEAVRRVWEEMPLLVSMEKEQKRLLLERIHRNIKSRARIREMQWWKVAAVVLPFLMLSSVLGYYIQQNRLLRQPEEFVVFADKGEKTRLVLPDGTKVWLNGGSKLFYATTFNREDRRVYLEGGGYFEVNKKDKMKFTVQTANVEVVVMGTKFQVTDYGEEKGVEVALLEGQVKIYNNKQEQITTLLPKQVAHISKETGHCEVINGDAEMCCLWVQNKLIFQNADIFEVVRKLERWYGVNIALIPQAVKHHYTFTLKTESLRETLYLIDELTPIVYTIKGEEVVISSIK